MGLTKPTFKVTNISELSTKPNATEGLNDTTFKALFDKSPSDAKDYLSDLCDEIDALILAQHPIGSIYMSVDDTNPSTLFGGTWVAWGAGRVPVGVNASDTEFDTVEETGGAKTHTLTIDEIPSHNHSMKWAGGTGTPLSSRLSFSGNSNYQTVDNADVNSTGGGQAHSNLQPYITCYMFKRTA